MTRKKSAYRPKPRLVNPLGFVLAMVSKVTDAQDHDTLMRSRTHMAYAALSKGLAGENEINELSNASNVAQALKRQGYGTDWADELYEGACAVEALQNRAKTGRYIAWAKELQAIKLMLEVHDAQLDAVSVGEFNKAVTLAATKAREAVQ